MANSNLPKLVCIEYPGKVKNIDKMLETFGGESELNRTFNDASARLELRFRPKDIHSHLAFGDRLPTSNLLVKCIKKEIISENGEKSYKYETHVVGIIDTTYRFQSLADFQYLPMQRKEETSDDNKKVKFKSVINEVIPAKPFSLTKDMKKEFNANASLFILPAIFSRFDSPNDYGYRDPPTKRNNELNNIDKLPIIVRNREPRTLAISSLSWHDEISEKPSEEMISNVIRFSSDKTILEKLHQLFDERPIWSRNGLLYRLNTTKANDLRYALSCVAYLYLSGPFRCMWVKFGYSPKLDKSSKIYQTLELRLRSQKYIRTASVTKLNNTSIDEKIPPKNSIFHYILPIRKKKFLDKSSRYHPSFIDADLLRQSSGVAGGSTNTSTVISTEESEHNDLQSIENENNNKTNKLRDKLYSKVVFKNDLLPSCRISFYQLCDIYVDEVQNLIHKNDGHEPETCDEKDGWCEAGTIDAIRSILSKSVDEMLANCDDCKGVLENEEAVGDEEELDDDEDDDNEDNDLGVEFEDEAMSEDE